MPLNLLITLRGDKERCSSLVRVVKASQKRSTADRTDIAIRDEQNTQVFQFLYHFEERNSVGGFLLVELFIEAEEVNGPTE